MCSIFGVFDIKTDAVELRKKALELSRLMRHRGPDWSGIYASDNAILAHERLSIVDVNAGAQPLYNQQKTHVLAVNGEIYNHQALPVISSLRSENIFSLTISYPAKIGLYFPFFISFEKSIQASIV